jgi:hypothetical protein
MKHLFFLFSLLASVISVSAQDCDTSVYISGKVLNENGRPMYDAMVVNRSKGSGQFCEPDGSFLIKACQSDELQVAATGFSSQRFSFADTLSRPHYTINITLKQLRISVPEVEVIAPRDLESINNDIQSLGFNEKDFRTSGVNAIQSPITFLYEAFSKRERSKRLAIELTNNDLRRALLKELFAKYVEYEILDLEDDEFDAFIDFMDPGDQRLKSFTQYEFILYVQKKYVDYKRFGRSISPSDQQYHLDVD